MFENLKALPQDSILQLMMMYRADDRSHKVDLGIGVYKDDAGNTPIMSAVDLAQKKLIETETTKSYIGPAGSPLFNEKMRELLLGADHPVLRDNRVTSAQTPGGCGALRIAAEFLVNCAPETTVWVSDPTWANHMPLLGDAGLKLATYPYYDFENKGIRFDAMMEQLELAQAGDVVLLHGCCHNPSGADLNQEQWAAVADLVERKGLLPFVDIAYQGLGNGLEEDAAGLRLMASRVPEMIIAASCSKNFGLYRERTGLLMVVSANAEQAATTTSQLFNTIRAHYSMPPAHGASVVETILSDQQLNENWLTELAGMRNRISGLRGQLASEMNQRGHDFSFITQEFGMFSFFGITPEQVQQMREEFAIYMIDSSRVNVAGLADHNITYVADALAKVLDK